MPKLTHAKIKSLEKPGLHGDGQTLFLRVAPGGSKQWVQRLTIDGKRRDFGLGGWPLVSLREAREKAFDNRRAVYQGRDILAERRKVKVPTFREAAQKTIAALSPRWRSPKVKANWENRLQKYAFPLIGEMPINEVDQTHVISVLSPLWGKKQETARKMRQYVNTTMQWALANRLIESNPASDDLLSGALPSMPAVKQNFRALPYQEVGEAVEIVRASRASMSAKACFEFVVLTACRSGEVRMATWSEIDLDSQTWRIPGAKMKTGKEHRVPLSDEAVAVLKQANAIRDESDLIFPSPQRAGKPLSNMSLTKLLRDNGLAEKGTIHGFRSSFRDWCAEHGVARELAEAALAHSVAGVEGAYFRSDLFERRAAVMQSWADYLRGIHDQKVVSILGA